MRTWYTGPGAWHTAAQEKPARAGMERKDGGPWFMEAFLELNFSYRKGRLVHTKLWKDGSRGSPTRMRQR